MKREKRRFEKGITLIALIITIVVLLILAAIAILSIKENQIIGRAEYAAERYQMEKIEEKIRLEKSSMKLAKYGAEITVKDVLEKFGEESTDSISIAANAKSVPENMPEGKYYILTPEKYASNNGNIIRYARITSRGEERQENILKDVYVINEQLDIYYIVEANLSVDNGENEERDISALEKYILGADLKGRNLAEIMDVDNNVFVNEEETIFDASTRFTAISAKSNPTDSLEVMYFKDVSDNSNIVTYKFAVNYYYDKATDEDIYTTSTEHGVVKIYETGKTTRVGKTVNYDDKLWTILYDDNTNGLQMVSNQALLYNGNEFYLGENDSSITDWSVINTAEFDGISGLDYKEKAIYSYNNAIDTLNTACESIVSKNENIKDVRSVGSNPINKEAENDTLFTSENLKKWPIDDATFSAGIWDELGKSMDLNYVSDFDMMVALGIHIAFDNSGSAKEYWLASRCIEVDDDQIHFETRDVDEDGEQRNGYQFYWRVNKSNLKVEDGNNCLRPIICLNSSVEFVEDPSGAADYTF